MTAGMLFLILTLTISVPHHKPQIVRVYQAHLPNYQETCADRANELLSYVRHRLRPAYRVSGEFECRRDDTVES